jgi:CHAD domain-containing protein
MSKKYKWEINELSCANSLKESALLILRQRVQCVTTSIKKYFDDESVENLHETRIALRRLRYNMEIFISCFDKAKFIAFYKLVEHLQDMTGTKRDLDVLIVNIKNICIGDNNSKINSILEKAGEQEKKLKESLTLELMKFTHGKALKDFNKMLL